MTYADQMAQFDTGKLSGANTGRGYNATTSTGRAFFPLCPNPNEIHIEDVGLQLSRICRFNGALRPEFEIYTVAQHCCLVSDHCPPELALEGLLHDAHEAYVGDMTKPIKLNLTLLSGWDVWGDLEHRVEHVVRIRFGLPERMTPEVKHQDYLAVTTEHRDLHLHTGEVDWGDMPTPWPDKIWPWPQRRAYLEFMRRFHALYRPTGDCHAL